jgi:ATP-binding cassette subfamily B protein
MPSTTPAATQTASAPTPDGAQAAHARARGKPASLRALWPFLRPYRWQVLMAAVFLLGSSAATLAFPWALKGLIDQGLVAPDRSTQLMQLRQHMGVLFGVAIAMGLLSAARYYTVSWLGERVTADLRDAVYTRVLHQSPAFFETTRVGEVLSRLTTDTTLVQSVVGSSLSMGLRNAVTGTGAIVMLIWTNAWMMLQVLVAVACVVLPAMWFGRRVRKLSRASQDRVADASAVAGEVLGAMPVVQAFTAEGREAARFAQATESAVQTAMRRTKARAVLLAFIIIANAAVMLWGLYLGTQAVLNGSMSAGTLGQTAVYVMLLASSVAVLGEVYGEILRAAGASERLIELLQAPVQIQSSATARVPAAASTAMTAGTSAGSTPDLALENEAATAKTPALIALDGLSYSYPSRPESPSLCEVSVQIAEGETVALVGPSGAGKSTLFHLLQRFDDPQKGSLRLQGQDLREWPLHALRERLAIVPQDATIFSASAADNIRYGRPDASDAEVIAAAQAAFADEFLRALPQGYDTHLGEHGVRLSGGQRQRLAIARALLKQAPILLLDEATSALDAESERMVQAALDATVAHKTSGPGQRPRTTLVIAHRLATVKRADRILVFDHGRLVETGTHDSLIADGQIYARLAALQFTGKA